MSRVYGSQRFDVVIYRSEEQNREKMANTACTRPFDRVSTEPTYQSGPLRTLRATLHGNLCGLKLVPAKWRCLILPTSGKRKPFGGL